MDVRIRAGSGNTKAIIAIKNLKERSTKALRSAFYKIGKDLKASANKSILAKPKGGKVYRVKRGAGMIRHVSSAPGETPANLSGDLRRSLDFNVVGSDKLVFGYREKFAGKTKRKGVFYGKFLELGTRKMKPRPGLQLAIKKNQRNMLDHFSTELEEKLNK